MNQENTINILHTYISGHMYVYNIRNVTYKCELLVVKQIIFNAVLNVDHVR